MPNLLFLQQNLGKRHNPTNTLNKIFDDLIFLNSRNDRSLNASALVEQGVILQESLDLLEPHQDSFPVPVACIKLHEPLAKA